MTRSRPKILVTLGMAAVLSTAVVAMVQANATNLDPAIPAVKQAIIDSYAARQADGLAHPAPKPGLAAVPMALPPLTMPTVVGTPSGAGYIVSDADTMRPPGNSTDQFTNGWYALGPTLNVDVWAATHATDPAQAFLLVVLWDANRLSVKASGTFDTPSKVGPVHVTAALGTTLMLRAADGTTFAFDAVGRAFVKAP